MTKVITAVFATLFGLVILTHIGILFWAESQTLRKIHETRTNVIGFWAVIGEKLHELKYKEILSIT